MPRKSKYDENRKGKTGKLMDDFGTPFTKFNKERSRFEENEVSKIKNFSEYKPVEMFE